MKKLYMTLLFICMLFLSYGLLKFNTAALDFVGEKIIHSQTQYFETFDFNGKIFSKEINKGTYEFKNNLQELYSSENKFLSSINDLQDLDGGGSSSQTLIVNGTTNLTKLFCTRGVYYYCKASAIKQGTTTKLETTVTLNPNSTTGLKVRNVLTWSKEPTYSITDFMSISYNGVYLDPDRATIKGTSIVNYDNVKRNIYGSIISRTPSVYTKSYAYETNKSIYQIEEHGVIWEIRNVYKSYFAIDPGDAPFIYDINGNIVMEAQVKQIQYVLEADLDLITGSKYSDHNKLVVSGDYVHTYPGINFTSNLTLRATLKGPQAFIGISVTPTISADGTRKTDIEIYFT